MMVNLIIDQGLVEMSECSEKNERIYADFAIMHDSKYDTKYFVHRVIKFLREHPERAPDYIDFVGDDWETRKLDE